MNVYFIITQSSSKTTNEIPVSTFEKRNAIFFEKLKERLNTTTSGLTPIAVCSSGTINNNLKCWCTYQANNQYDYDNHKKTHHTALSVLSYNDDDDYDEDNNYDDDNDNIEDDNYDDDDEINDDIDINNSLKCPFCDESWENEKEKNKHVRTCLYSLEENKINMMKFTKLQEMYNNDQASLGYDGYHALDSSGSSVRGFSFYDFIYYLIFYYFVLNSWWLWNNSFFFFFYYFLLVCFIFFYLILCLIIEFFLNLFSIL